MSLLLYMSEFEDPFTDFAKEQPALHFENITYGDWKAHREAELVIDIPESVQNNASFYGHFYLVAKPHEDGKGMKDFVAKEPLKVLHTKKLLTRFFAPAKPKAAKKLLMSDQQESEEGALPIPFLRGLYPLRLIGRLTLPSPSFPTWSLFKQTLWLIRTWSYTNDSTFPSYIPTISGF